MSSVNPGHEAMPAISFPVTRPLKDANRSPVGRVATKVTSSPFTVPSSLSSFSVPVSFSPLTVMATRMWFTSLSSRAVSSQLPDTSAAETDTAVRRTNSAAVAVFIASLLTRNSRYHRRLLGDAKSALTDSQFDMARKIQSRCIFDVQYPSRLAVGGLRRSVERQRTHDDNGARWCHTLNRGRVPCAVGDLRIAQYSIAMRIRQHT